jgi:hypothetical protein
MGVISVPRFNWDGIEIGETRSFAWTSRSAAATSFAKYAKVRGLDWECASRSDPATPVRGKPCKTVWITRVAPRKEPNGVIIPEADNPAVQKRPEPFEPIPGKQRRQRLWILDMKEIPEADRKDIYESRSDRVRKSRVGWDQMGLDEWKVVRTERGELRAQIINICIPRGLLWRFHITRCMPPEAERSGPYANDVWHYVKRVR